jgi:ferredoxin
MPYVVTEACINAKHTDCVEVCPVDCFYEGPNMVVIHPDECIDCNACVPVCPSEAIYPANAVPDEYENYVEINERLARRWREKGRKITEKTGPLDDASGGENLKKSEENIRMWPED